MGRGSEFNFHKKNLRLGGGRCSFIFSFYSFTLEGTWCPFLQQKQKCIILFSGCLNIFVFLFVGNMLIIRNVQEPSIAFQWPAFLSLTLLLRSII